MIIYIDILLIFNLYMNYILLSLTARLTHRKLLFWRSLLGAGLGSLSACMIVLPAMPILPAIVCRIAVAVLICLTAFGRQRLVWSCLCFFGISFLTAGLLMAVSMLTQVSAVYQNTYWYLDISLLHLIVFTIIAYGLLSLVQYIHDRTHVSEEACQILIRYENHVIRLDGLADTGNALTDFYTGKPVIVCDKTALQDMHPKHSHLVPYMTIAGSSMLEVFQPDEVMIVPESGSQKTVDAVIGIGEQENRKAIFHPKLLHY